MYDIRRPCENGPDCSHKICHACEYPIRSHQQKKHDHPGAVPGHIRNRLCDRCMIEGHKSIHDIPKPEPEPEPDFVFKDERDVLLTDEQMERIMIEEPHMFTWHAKRRKRLRLGEYSR